MSWKDRAARAVAKGAGGELTKPTKAPSVSFVGAVPALVSATKDRDAANASTFDLGTEDRRQKVLAMLDAKPGFTRAMVTDDEAEPDDVIITVAIRGVGTADIRVPRESYDPFALLELLARHDGTSH